MDPLEILAGRCGIEGSFEDARGQVQRTTPATRQALLTAMGVTADSNAAAIAALDALDREEWLPVVPPVLVVFGTNPLILPIRCPPGTGTVRWRLTLESGEERGGDAGFESLQLLQRREIAGELREQRSLLIDTALPFGYHRLALTPGDAQSTLIVTPGRCWLPPLIEQGKRLWGVAAQLYLLKSKANWGIGDFADLRELAQLLVQQRRSGDRPEPTARHVRR